MPLTKHQRSILALLASVRTPDSYLAGGAALHFSPKSIRFSNDLDFFNDSTERVASAFARDNSLLEAENYQVEVVLSQPGFIRAIVTRGNQSTRIDWAHDSAWRFMPPIKDALGGFVLHKIDLAINKVLALAGRNEPRDYVDILYIIQNILPLGPLCWAAVGKDPGLTPSSLLGLLRRRGRYQPEEISRLDLAGPFDLTVAKTTWLQALDDAEAFVTARPTDELGCLYYSSRVADFVSPDNELELAKQYISIHFGSPGGLIPRPADKLMED